mmetsp:Transcript_42920/g.77225  ORF Transcript_42920/g.77225 Transcript_42920/m.77225 type:complete len:244 (-) Transcript_42920:336-1067(-)|eukprot:CAMPEP_0197654104 /NCGR_PEP_ID=MMETSP1338-20131121/38655_1 /TAXON_ID=43686 ORGANISM="Pelagodinium beii, Strain RCC1491" /NCGR_SAMPLE_ID=MMETSP1338 /ASSEMBLY_ACC=CAM_ASM_000754 /LENGTH=243 /DNA_ID=CAMNT_0043229491 /DNA_START=102 /DNA_END=833 /DNA_ORIENTATION=+
MHSSPQHMGPAVLGSHVRIQQFKRTKLCKFNLEGACTRGAYCNFAHSVEDMEEQPDYSKTRLCVDFMEGKCTHGSKCKFAHGKRDLKASSVFKIENQRPEPPAGSQQAQLLHDEVQRARQSLATLSFLRAHLAHEAATINLLLHGQVKVDGAFSSPRARHGLQGLQRRQQDVADHLDVSTLEQESPMSFSRSTTASNHGGEPAAALQTLTTEHAITVKNTFLHFALEEDAKPGLRKSHSVPQL